jgi:Zn-dependent M28 family amino/carboxypeptidase
LAQFFRDRTRNVTEQTFEHVDLQGDTLYLCNIVASFWPAKGARVLLGAHWDTRPRADRDPDTTRRHLPILGANDGASGVAVLMEIANALSSREPPVGVDIVLFDGEDYGEEGNPQEYLLGSRHFASAMKEYRPVWGAIVDMVGDRDLGIPQERVSLSRAPGVVRMVWDEALRQGAESFKPWPGQAIMDDHWPLLDRGVPCIDIIDFDYPYWHTHQDVPERCSPRSLAEVGGVLLGVIY